MSEDRYRTRRPIPSDLLLGGHAAKRCPLRVVYDRHPPPGVAPEATPEPSRRWMEAGRDFEVTILDELAAHCPDHVRIDPSLTTEQRIAHTVRAIEAGAPLILGGTLPPDTDGHRTGQPDVLVRAERRSDRSWAYHPIEVKHHSTIQIAKPTPRGPRFPEGWTVSTSSLALPGWHARTPHSHQRFSPYRRFDDWLQLAHYWRMLDAFGHASTQTVGAVIGRERRVVWADLADPVLRPTWSSRPGSPESALQRYDMEFSFRLDAVAAAGKGEWIVEPVNTFECADCPWRNKCTPDLAAEHHVSLVPGVGYRAWRIYRHMQVRSEGDLAEVDRRSAELLDRWPRGLHTITELVEQCDHAPATTPLASLLTDGQTAAVELLADTGFHQVGDVAEFDRRLLAADGWMTGVARHIDNARIRAWTDSTPHRAPGIDAVTVPGADVEIDIDMESGFDGRCYLWGALDNTTGTYTGTADWSADSATSGARVFVDFWELIRGWRGAAAASNQTVAFYCWNAQAEKDALRSGAELAAEMLGHDVREEVAEFFSSGQIVDLLVSFRDQVMTGQSNSLKSVAPLAGFGWEDDNPSGAESMLWHEAAVSPASADDAADEMRQRLLTYNRNDCEATAAVRQWMRQTALASVLDLTLDSR